MPIQRDEQNINPPASLPKSPPRRPSRREVLGAGVGAGLLAVAGAGTEAQGSGRTGVPATGKAKNVIFLVVDGMSMGTFTIADMVMQRQGGTGSHWANLWSRQGVRRSMMATRSADSLVTDSAAGGSAWGCGRRLYNGSICFDKTTGEIEPILVTAKNAGKSTGLVSTARITHATPASFVASVPTRNMEKIIAEQELERGVDVLLGGGAKNFSDELLAGQTGLTVVRTADQMRAAAGARGRLLGLFTDDHMSYELDRPDTEPHIREMSMLAIDRLSQNPKGFVLQVEAGRVDHGGHANDFPAMLHDQLAFEETIEAVSAWAMARDDTLVIITTDHGNGGPELTVYEENAARGMDNLLNTKHTMTWMLAQLRGRPSEEWPNGLRDLVFQHSGIELTDEQIEWAFRPTRGERVNAFGGANSLVSAIGAVMADHFGIAFVSKNHTAEHVEATAFGPGAEALAHRIENYELHGLMTRAMALA